MRKIIIAFLLNVVLLKTVTVLGMQYYGGEIFDVVIKGNVSYFKTLLYSNTNLVCLRDKTNATLLHWASWVRSDPNLTIIMLLLENEADINARDMNRLTPLHWVAFKGNKSIVELLIDEGADVNVVSFSGRTPKELVELKKKNATKANSRAFDRLLKVVIEVLSSKDVKNNKKKSLASSGYW